MRELSTCNRVSKSARSIPRYVPHRELRVSANDERRQTWQISADEPNHLLPIIGRDRNIRAQKNSQSLRKPYVTEPTRFMNGAAANMGAIGMIGFKRNAN
jgi:hypothetical protein